jgi:hypothetical protein
VKARWISAGLGLAAVGLGAALWLTTSSNPPAEAPPEAAPAPGPIKAAKAVEPLGQAAWLIAHAQPKAPPSQHPTPNDEGCGAEGEPCPEGAVCLDGGCVTTSCEPDGGRKACALPTGELGTCCGDRCASLAADAANCGQCGQSCQAGLECVAGHCEARSCVGHMAGTPCAGGICCRSACEDSSVWESDSQNCGGCGHACAPGLTCKQSACVDAATGAAPTWTCLEPAHACPDGTFCVLDACYPSQCTVEREGLLCPSPPGGHCCGQLCTDLFSDKDNCRVCGAHCAEGQICKAGECTAPGP